MQNGLNYFPPTSNLPLFQGDEKKKGQSVKLLNVNERKKILKSELNRIVNIIKREYKPDRIILFGSLANGKVHEWSDIDLLIVKDTEKRPVDRCIEICKLVHPNVGIDLFVYTPTEYEGLLEEKFSLLMNILKEGKFRDNDYLLCLVL